MFHRAKKNDDTNLFSPWEGSTLYIYTVTQNEMSERGKKQGMERAGMVRSVFSNSAKHNVEWEFIFWCVQNKNIEQVSVNHMRWIHPRSTFIPQMTDRIGLVMGVVDGVLILIVRPGWVSQWTRSWGDPRVRILIVQRVSKHIFFYQLLVLMLIATPPEDDEK